MFRGGIWSCTGMANISMSGDEIMENGYCGCLDLDFDNINDANIAWDYITLLIPDFLEENYTDDEIKYVSKVMCETPIALGEALQSSATLDPIFWPMHPTMERLFMYKRLTGTMEDMTWPNKSGWYFDLEGDKTYYTTSVDSDSCFGHGGND
ncbi:unnamed protein product, partial [Choristocarpus tenellus]